MISFLPLSSTCVCGFKDLYFNFSSRQRKNILEGFDIFCSLSCCRFSLGLSYAARRIVSHSSLSSDHAKQSGIRVKWKEKSSRMFSQRIDGKIISHNNRRSYAYFTPLRQEASRLRICIFGNKSTNNEPDRYTRLHFIL
jgi:hypothetical protein